ncbi:MAG: S9 family peptidase, partial [Candidatus Micropelagos thuwalensis]
HRPSKVMRHKIGTNQADDVLVYEEEDAGFFVSLSQSRSESLIFISAHDHETSEVHMINAADPEQKPVTIAPREPHIEYDVSHDAQRNRLIILTNKDAVDFRLMWANIETPDKWHELVPHKKGTLILKVATYENFIVWLYREKALPKINILSTETNLVTEIAFQEEAYDVSLDTGLEYNTNMVRFIYTSMTTPRQIFDYEMSTGKRNMVYEQSVPSGHNAQDYVTKRLWAPIEDVNQEIPITLLYHKDTALDGSAPVLLYGYGAYGISIPASFSGNRLSLVDRGFIYAIAHIRGGKEMGFDWFQQGRKENKINSFKDFAAAAEYLIDNNFTQKGNITIHGGSAGGLLVGATLNLKPDLFRGAIAEVPFVDVLNTMLDDTLPLTPPEWPEWGNPILNATDYQTIAEYAPYENISKKAYPHILATAGLTDPRVTYWEPAKWVARLRDNRTDDGLTLLRTEMSAGHGGKAGRFNQLEELALVYGFVLSIHEISD